MRLDEQAHHCEVLNALSEYQNSRSGWNRGKEDVLTWGGLCNHEMVEQRSQQKS